MQFVSASELKARCAKLIDCLGPDGVVITRHGMPVARLIPFARRSAVPAEEPRVSESALRRLGERAPD